MLIAGRLRVNQVHIFDEDISRFSGCHAVDLTGKRSFFTELNTGRSASPIRCTRAFVSGGRGRSTAPPDQTAHVRARDPAPRPRGGRRRRLRAAIIAPPSSVDGPGAPAVAVSSSWYGSGSSVQCRCRVSWWRPRSGGGGGGERSDQVLFRDKFPGGSSWGAIWTGVGAPPGSSVSVILLL
jgi:hypothetical protein